MSINVYFLPIIEFLVIQIVWGPWYVSMHFSIKIFFMYICLLHMFYGRQDFTNSTIVSCEFTINDKNVFSNISSAYFKMGKSSKIWNSSKWKFHARKS